MKYVFDTNTLSGIFRHYYYDIFPGFWIKFISLKDKNLLISVREVRREIEELRRGDELEKWVSLSKDFFEDPSVEELSFVTQIYKLRHFQQNMKKKEATARRPFC